MDAEAKGYEEHPTLHDADFQFISSLRAICDEWRQQSRLKTPVRIHRLDLQVEDGLLGSDALSPCRKNGRLFATKWQLFDVVESKFGRQILGLGEHNCTAPIVDAG